MTTEPTEGWLTQSPLYRESGIPAVSVAECDRRVKAERDRCVTAIRDAFTKYAGLGRQWERDAVRAALAAIEHPDATGDTPRSTP